MFAIRNSTSIVIYITGIPTSLFDSTKNKSGGAEVSDVANVQRLRTSCHPAQSLWSKPQTSLCRQWFGDEGGSVGPFPAAAAAGTGVGICMCGGARNIERLKRFIPNHEIAGRI